MAKPSGATGNIKMIGATRNISGAQLDYYSDNTSKMSYYLLYEDGNLYTLGNNTNRQIGDWTTNDANTWKQPKYISSTGQVMNDIKWISPQEHDANYPFVTVITVNKEIYNWGAESGYALGRGAQAGENSTSNVNPGQPTTFQTGYSNSGMIVTESGGHTTLMMKECASTFGLLDTELTGAWEIIIPIAGLTIRLALTQTPLKFAVHKPYKAH
ncbi:MAG TPA: hypothetical protein PKX92_09085 [Edaphocola sp.]|nr:hypothetical protein [Edaphocola sp.]